MARNMEVKHEATMAGVEVRLLARVTLSDRDVRVIHWAATMHIKEDVRRCADPVGFIGRKLRGALFPGQAIGEVRPTDKLAAPTKSSTFPLCVRELDVLIDALHGWENARQLRMVLIKARDSIALASMGNGYVSITLPTLPATS